MKIFTRICTKERTSINERCTNVKFTFTHRTHIQSKHIVVIHLFVCLNKYIEIESKNTRTKTGRTLPVALIFDSSNVAKHTLIKHTTMLYMVLLHIFLKIKNLLKVAV